MASKAYKAFLFFWGLVFITGTQCLGQSGNLGCPGLDDYLYDGWVDSVYQQMTPEQRISQLFWIAVEVIESQKRFDEYQRLVEDYQPGGILYMKTSAELIEKFSNKARVTSKVPLFVAIDGEWGLAMRIDDVRPFPKAMTMGAVQDLNLHYMMGMKVAEQLKRLGIQINLAPVADVNSNPENPIIGFRSYGENAVEVAKRSVAYMRGMQDEGIMAVAKHFPGHGNTSVDSHLSLPTVGQDRAVMDSVDLVPFNALIKNGIFGIMTGHLKVPALDSTGTPASLSHAITTGLLQKNMGFYGLVITDAMNMKGAKDGHQNENVDLLALIAGNDVIESTENLPKSISDVKSGIQSGKITWAEVERKCRKSLAMKRLLGMARPGIIQPDHVVNDLNAMVDPGFVQMLYDKSICFIPNDSVKPETKQYSKEGFMKLGNFDSGNQIHDGDSLAMDFFSYASAVNQSQLDKMKGYDELFIGVCQSNESLAIWNGPVFQQFFNALPKSVKVTVVYAGSPYYLNRFRNTKKASALLIGFEQNRFTYQALARFIRGDIEASGKLPVTINPIWAVGSGIVVKR